MSRKSARRDALFVLYQWDVTGKPLASLHEGELDPYAQELVDGVAVEAESLDARIDHASSEWSVDRLGALERNVLRIALFELDRGEVPLEAAIDEAVRLAKRFASAEAAGLVNGILARIVREPTR